MSRAEVLRIGCGAGFWGDSPEGPRQLVRSGQIDVLVLDYLAEITMSLLAKARAKDANAGYAADFVEVIAELAPEIAERGIKLVTNAGGVNPRACRDALEKRLQALGVSLRIGIVTGDDLLDRSDEFRAAGVEEMFSATAFPISKPWSSNAYLGAGPIAAALNAGADIVITGRCVDSALALGPLIAHFGWASDDYDRLAGGSLAGHVIECGVQATGGIVTDWKQSADDWDRMGFPIAECRADGSFVLTKPAGSGGWVSTQSVAEQIVYEVGDPAAYLLPDVSCDFRELKLITVGIDRIEVRGARGLAPSSQYKVSTTYQDGFRSSATMTIGGVDAVQKAHAVAAAILKRTRRLFSERKLADYTRTDVELIGSETNWGLRSRAKQTRELVLKIGVQHADKAALEIFSKEVIPSATSMAQGITGFSGGRPSVTPVVRLFSWLVDKSLVSVVVDVDGQLVDSAASKSSSPGAVAPPSPARGRGDSNGRLDIAENAASQSSLPRAGESPAEGGERGAFDRSRSIPLIELAHARSGDKGDSANIGVLARKPQHLPLLRDQLTAKAVRDHFAHYVEGPVHRYDWPGLQGFNFVLERALGGGGMASLRNDPQGKLFAQVLMDFPIQVPEGWQP